MRVLVVSDTLKEYTLGWHLHEEGHAVTQIVAHSNSSAGPSLTHSVITSHPDVVLYTCDKYGTEADEQRSQGLSVIGASKWSKIIEDDPDYAGKLMSLAGWTYSNETTGINLYLTLWFNKSTILSSYASLVYRRFMSGGSGPDLSFTGAVSCFNKPTIKVIEKFHKPLEKMLRRVSHQGCVHVHILTNGDNYVVKELNASFNHPLSLLFFENSKGSMTENLLKLRDDTSKPIDPLEPWATGILLSVPPYPYDLPLEPTIVKGLVPGNLKHLWLANVSREGELWKVKGSRGKVGYVTARGSTVSEAIRRAYRTISNLAIKDLQYRDDIGRNINSLLATLRQGGWIQY